MSSVNSVLHLTYPHHNTYTPSNLQNLDPPKKNKTQVKQHKNLSTKNRRRRWPEGEEEKARRDWLRESGIGGGGDEGGEEEYLLRIRAVVTLGTHRRDVDDDEDKHHRHANGNAE